MKSKIAKLTEAKSRMVTKVWGRDVLGDVDDGYARQRGSGELMCNTVTVGNNTVLCA